MSTDPVMVSVPEEKLKELKEIAYQICNPKVFYIDNDILMMKAAMIEMQSSSTILLSRVSDILHEDDIPF